MLWRTRDGAASYDLLLYVYKNYSYNSDVIAIAPHQIFVLIVG
jgi:hypothetical protein